MLDNEVNEVNEVPRFFIIPSYFLWVLLSSASHSLRIQLEGLDLGDPGDPGDPGDRPGYGPHP